MNSKTVRNLFIFFLIWLPVQYGLAGYFGAISREPWPVFTFPGFKSVYVNQGLYEIPQTYFELYNTRGEKTGTFKPYQFFPELPRSQISGFMRTHFQDVNSIERLSDETRNWLKTNSRQITDSDVTSVEVISTVEYYRRTNTGLEIDSANHQFTAVITFDDL